MTDADSWVLTTLKALAQIDKHNTPEYLHTSLVHSLFIDKVTGRDINIPYSYEVLSSTGDTVFKQLVESRSNLVTIQLTPSGQSYWDSNVNLRY